ncbi:MAG TPA: diguanylate cyclase [Solirubrobacteraceae bacterium]|nr:diguanylate cyclase [Solirubrobacteraceae bacterium]
MRWRSLAALFVAGGLLALVSLGLPHPPGRHDAFVAGLAAIAVVSGLGLALFSQRLDDRLLAGFLAFGVLLITLGVFAGGRAGEIYAFLYIWIAIEAFYFLGQRGALAQLLGIAAASGLTVLAGPLRADQWLMVDGTAATVGALVAVLRAREVRLIARLGEAAHADWLTGLRNRRGFQDALEHEVERALRSGRPSSLVVGDLDGFKRLNDRLGHPVGDEALRHVGLLLREAGRTIDVAARIGGEEFALLLPDTDEHGAYVVAERLRASVREHLVLAGWGVSISLGVTSFPRHATSAAEVLHTADQAMYSAKALGRDRTVVFSRTLGEEMSRPRADAVAREEHLSAVLVLAEALDLRDADTALHARTVARYAAMTGRALGLGPARIERLHVAGLLHDVGKVGVADTILRKPGPLTDAEWAEMRKHSELGARIVAGANLPDVAGWVLAHHERPDGGGYPAGLRADRIPLEALILAVADAFEAMTGDRVYRRGMPEGAARAELRRCAGTQFDPAVVEAFLGALGDGPGAVAAEAEHSLA